MVCLLLWSIRGSVEVAAFGSDYPGAQEHVFLLVGRRDARAPERLCQTQFMTSPKANLPETWC